MLATRSVTDCLKHIMCPMEQVPGFTSKTLKKAYMLGECPHCGWEKKLDYAMESDFPITWQGFERRRVGEMRPNIAYGQEEAFVEGEKKTRQERVKVGGLFHGDFVVVPSNKWWQTEASIARMVVKELKAALRARGLRTSGLKAKMASRSIQFEIQRKEVLDQSGNIATAALAAQGTHVATYAATNQPARNGVAKPSFLALFRNHIVKKLGKHIFMKHWDIHTEAQLNANIETHKLGNILQYDGDWAQGFNIIDKEAVQSEHFVTIGVGIFVNVLRWYMTDTEMAEEQARRANLRKVKTESKKKGRRGRGKK